MKNRLALMVGATDFERGCRGGCASVRRSATTAARAGAGARHEPSSSVARISLTHGDVSTQRGDSGDWAAAALNQPMVSSDKVSTGVNSRAEVQLDSANILRLGDSTLASIAGLSRNQIQVQVDAD